MRPSSIPPFLPTRPAETAPISVTPQRQQHVGRKSTPSPARPQIASLHPYSLSELRQREHRVGTGRMQLASLKTPTGLGSTHALFQNTASGESSIASNFNGTTIPGGSFIWFSSGFKASRLA